MSTPAPTDQAAQYQGQSEKVTHFPQIVSLLRRVLDSHTLLSITIPGSDHQYSSMLLGIKPEENIVLFDELNNAQGHKKLIEARKLTAHCRCQGVQLSFSCKVEILKSKGGGAVYRSEIPPFVLYLQRRAVYRVRVPLALEIPVMVPLESGKVLRGQLYDISVLGIGVRIENQPAIRKDQSFPDTRICLPDEEELNTEIEIRYVLEDAHHKPIRFGAKFASLDLQHQQMVRCLVTQLEREWLRKQVKK